VEPRVPPGQRVLGRPPVLHIGPTPTFDERTWDLRVFGLVKRPRTCTWKELLSMPAVDTISDFHCVTTWSVLNVRWVGVRLKDVLVASEPTTEARFIIAHCEQGYTTNLPIEDANRNDVLLAYGTGSGFLEPEHGFPLRLVVPHRYAWKSAKWVRGIELTAEDRPGFWEARGYHNEGDPWKEERYSER